MLLFVFSSGYIVWFALMGPCCKSFLGIPAEVGGSALPQGQEQRI